MLSEIEKRTAPASVIVDVFLRKTSAPRNILDGSSCPRILSRRRQMLMWLLQRLTNLSLMKIGETLGGLDPTTVRSGISAVSDRMASDPHLHQWLLETLTECLAYEPSQLTEARRAVASNNAGTEERSLAVTVVCVASVLSSPYLTDAEARTAALTLICRNEGAPHAM